MPAQFIRIHWDNEAETGPAQENHPTNRSDRRITRAVQAILSYQIVKAILCTVVDPEITSTLTRSFPRADEPGAVALKTLELWWDHRQERQGVDEPACTQHTTEQTESDLHLVTAASRAVLRRPTQNTVVSVFDSPCVRLLSVKGHTDGDLPVC